MPEIRPQIRAMRDWLIEIRRDIHKHPELPYQEFRTSELMARHLRDFGLEVKSRVGQTGVVGLWRADRPGRCIGLRADMDALPVTEATGREWSSATPGVMHACGHDMHTTMLLGAARFFAENPRLKETLAGSVKFLFQPAEEGGGGAKAMIEDGAMENPPVDAVFGGHVFPILHTGQLGVTHGYSMASVDNFFITLKGSGGHAAHPAHASDPIAPGASLLLDIKRKSVDLDRGLIAVCTFHAGTQTNIIPDTAKLTGTIRSLRPETRKQAREIIKNSVADIGGKEGLEADLVFEEGYPMLLNDDRMVDLLREVAAQVIGTENVLEQEASYGAEDLAYFLERAPGVHYKLGCAREGSGPVAMLHSPEFDPDEDVLPIGVEIMVRLVESYLDGN